MAFLLFFFYILFSVVAPAEVFPELMSLHLGFWSGMLGILFAFLAVLTKGAEGLRLPQVWLLGLYTVLLCISTAISQHWPGAPIGVISGFSLSLIIFALVLINVDSLNKMKWTSVAVVLSSVLLSVQGIYAIKTGWNTARLMMPFVDTAAGQEKFEHDETYQNAMADIEAERDRNDPEVRTAIEQLYGAAKVAALTEGRISFRIRGNGVMHDPNDLALGLITTLPLCWLAFRKGKWFQNLLFVLVPTGLILTTVYHTHSRGGMVALLAIFAAMFWRRFGKVKSGILVGILLVAMIGLNFAGGRGVSDESSEGRLDAWNQGYHMLRSSPLLGVGYESFVDFNPITAHNSYVLCFSEGGLIGYFLWLAMLVVFMYQIGILMNISDTGETAQHIKQWAWALQLSMIGFLAGAFFLSRTYVYLLYMLVAMSGALLIIARKHDIQVEMPRFGAIAKRALSVEFGSLILIYLMVRAGH
jgi:hypothetical protein